jgi:YHS domain-containing protein
MAEVKKQEIAIDPICGREVDKQTAEFTYREGNTFHYFCSSVCKSAYIEKAKHPGAGTKDYNLPQRTRG